MALTYACCQPTSVRAVPARAPRRTACKPVCSSTGASRLNPVDRELGTRREVIFGAVALTSLIGVARANARSFEEAQKEKEARKAALRGAAKDMKETGKDETIFDAPEYSLSEEARTPNAHTRQNEGARRQKNA